MTKSHLNEKFYKFCLENIENGKNECNSQPKYLYEFDA